MNRLFLVCSMIAWFGLTSLPVPARVLCPRVVSEHTADASDWQQFRNFHRWKDKSGQELALAVWQYLSGYETGVYHFNEILEGNDPFNEYATVRDPQKILNIYNMGYCGIFGPVLDGVFQNIGFKQGRAFGIDLWNHCATELWYDNQWHYYDLDVRGLLLDENSRVASLKRAQNERRLWTDPLVTIDPFFPNVQDKGEVFEIYHDSQVNYYYRWFEGSHTMDYYLRQGETFTRWWKPQGGRWHHHPLYNQIPWVKELIQTEPLGTKPNHRDFTPWNHGNGLFQYTPNLTNRSSDFQDGVYSYTNLVPGRHGLEFVESGPAEAVFEVFTPYIIVAKINDFENLEDDTEASCITVTPGTEIRIDISTNHGMTWDFVRELSGTHQQTIDLTQWVEGTYGYLLKLSMQGDTGDVAFQDLAIDTWVQVAPISLPRLKQGKNHLRYDVGDRYGLETEPVLVQPNTADRDDVKRHFVKIPDDYDPQRNTSRMKGEAIMRLQASDDSPIAWFSVGATFRTYQGEQAEQTKNRIAYATGEPKQFDIIYSASVPTWVNHWRYNWDTDVTLDEPAKDVYIQYIGDPALNTVRACLHILPKEHPNHEVVITHGYHIDGQLHEQNVRLKEPDDYIIECEKEPENDFIKISVPSNTNNNESKE